MDGSKKANALEVEKHLASCAPCRLRVKEFRAVSGLLDELPVIEPSAAFDTRVHALVAAEPEPKAKLVGLARLFASRGLCVVPAADGRCIWAIRSSPVQPLISQRRPSANDAGFAGA